jgi:hypothetical protein
MLVPGVLQGSKGPLLYPADEVRKSPDDWNHIPIVVYHPMKDGKPVSARSPSILSKYGVGFVFHSRTDSKGVLKGEGWLDVEATRRVDKSVLDSVQLGKPIELSTGLFVDDEPAPEGAIFNDHRGTRKYVGIARNYKPDHLAILPSGKGACSLADGCGVLINEAAMEAYHVIVNELEAEAISLYFPDLELDLLTANKFNPNQPRDKAGRFATVAEGTAAVSKAQERVAKAQAALKEAKATLKVEKDGLLVARKGLAEVKGIEKARSPAGQRAIEKAKASTSEAHATGKKLRDLSGTLATKIGGKKSANELLAEGKAEVARHLAGIKTKAHAAALAEGFGILPGKTIAQTKAMIARHVEDRIRSTARVGASDRPAATGGTSGHATTSTPTAPKPAASPRASKSVSATHLTNPKGSTFGAHDPQGPIHLEGSPLRFGDLVHIHEPGGQPRLAAVAHAHRDVGASAAGVSSGTRVTIKPSAKYASDFGRTPSEVSMGFVRRATPEDVKAWSASSGKPVPHEVVKDFPALAAKTGGKGKSTKSVDEHHAETEALTRSPMSPQDASKAVDSHIAGLNKALNKAQAHELGQKLGLTHPKSATKKSVLDKIKTHIHARRGAHH